MFYSTFYPNPTIPADFPAERLARLHKELWQMGVRAARSSSDAEIVRPSSTFQEFMKEQLEKIGVSPDVPDDFIDFFVKFSLVDTCSTFILRAEHSPTTGPIHVEYARGMFAAAFWRQLAFSEKIPNTVSELRRLWALMHCNNTSGFSLSFCEKRAAEGRDSFLALLMDTEVFQGIFRKFMAYMTINERGRDLSIDFDTVNGLWLRTTVSARATLEPGLECVSISQENEVDAEGVSFALADKFELNQGDRKSCISRFTIPSGTLGTFQLRNDLRLDQPNLDTRNDRIWHRVRSIRTAVRVLRH